MPNSHTRGPDRGWFTRAASFLPGLMLTYVPHSQAARQHHRPDIQALRALAVAIVILFHVWPHLVPGGYVGVDVFFVISGYLITSSLAREAYATGRISLRNFYARRLRRLAPMATVVLLFATVGSFWFVSPANWETTAQQIAASALYVQNWALGFQAIDYLGAESAPTAVQHYWSLSIEEQFYIVWPLVMVAGLVIAAKGQWNARVVFAAALACIFVSSLAASVIVTASDRAWAYFATHTRAFELALGGLLALVNLPKLSRRTRLGLSTFGLIAILASAFTFDDTTAFPGMAALLPTLGAATMIAAGDVRLGPYQGLNYAPARWLGDVSYSAYLWHWPLIVFVGSIDAELGIGWGLGVIALTLALSALSYVHVEERFRHAAYGGLDRDPSVAWNWLAAGGTMAAASIAGALALQALVWTDGAATAKTDDRRYPGPAVLADGAIAPLGADPLPPFTTLNKDRPRLVDARRPELGPIRCHQGNRSAEVLTCVAGDADAARTIVLTGDSHAYQWAPALHLLGQQAGWRLVVMTRSACALSPPRDVIAEEIFSTCVEWQPAAIEAIDVIDPEIVVYAESRGHRTIENHENSEALRDVWRRLVGNDRRLIVLEDTPWLSFDPRKCDPAAEPCSVARNVAIPVDPMQAVFNGMPANLASAIQYIDMNDLVCGPALCTSVMGNVFVFRDRHHLTQTYVQQLAPYLLERMGPTLGLAVEDGG